MTSRVHPTRPTSGSSPPAQPPIPQSPSPKRPAPRPHLVNVWRDGLAAHAHALAVNKVAVLAERQPPHHHALLTRNNCRPERQRHTAVVFVCMCACVCTVCVCSGAGRQAWMSDARKRTESRTVAAVRITATPIRSTATPTRDTALRCDSLQPPLWPADPSLLLPNSSGNPTKQAPAAVPTVEAGAGAAKHAGQVVQNGVRLRLVLWGCVTARCMQERGTMRYEPTSCKDRLCILSAPVTSWPITVCPFHHALQPRIPMVPETLHYGSSSSDCPFLSCHAHIPSPDQHLHPRTSNSLTSV